MTMGRDALSMPEAFRSLPKGVIALGAVSLCMDLSSEMIHALLPVYLVAVLGVGPWAIGVIEGVAEATAALTKVVSGVLSDWWGRRKPLVLLGYGLATLSKPLFPLATGAGLVITARVVDRIGKGIRGAPRDALIADLTPLALRGGAFGLRQAMDTVGAVLGPLLALALMAASGGDFHLVFWVAVAPALLAVAVIQFAVRDAEIAGPAATTGQRRWPIRRAEMTRLPGRFWWVVGLAAVLTLARFSEAFLLLRAQDVGLANAYVPVVLIVMNWVYAVGAYPLGHLADRLDRRRLLASGIVALILADGVLAAADGVASVLAGAGLWGLHMAATQGLLAAMIADTAPLDLRGTAFGLFNLITGVALLLASVIAGGLWAAVGPAGTFAAGAVFAVLALVGLGRAAAASGA